MKIFAEKHNSEGNRFLDQGDYQRAEEKFVLATRSAPNWSVSWYNLGLIYKIQNRWKESFDCNQKAIQLNPNDEGALWNLGIAATALSQWSEAREAWTSYGISLSDGDGPIEMDLGNVPIRLNLPEKDEVVWCHRIDPARAIIKNIPYPSSGHCYNDLLLHDGAPNGYRQIQGREVPVFDELMLLTPSSFKTYEIKALFRSIEDIDILMEMGYQQGLMIEDWGTVRNLCKACSEGRPHNQHEIETTSEPRPIRLALAAQNEEEATQLSAAWEKERGGCKLSEIVCTFAH